MIARIVTVACVVAMWVYAIVILTNYLAPTAPN